ncbi:hypothetical protein SELMODRAFT_423017 [Selaginella moellendorffii]|uniref:Uncharacterized protein n=1 Tax=Selaginella moellendorffii TaxID=88036 RepID=D8SKA8_SELML|nr:hypothetical protein SELMODRAFT_423017 [Selaginella moellendorffii]
MAEILNWLADTDCAPSRLSEYFIHRLLTIDFTIIFANCRTVQSLFDSPSGVDRPLTTCLLVNLKVSHDSLSQEMKDAVHELLLRGQLMRNQRGTYCLPSRVHERFFTRRIFKGILPVAEVSALGIKLFLVKVLEHFSLKAL